MSNSVPLAPDGAGTPRRLALRRLAVLGTLAMSVAASVACRAEPLSPLPIQAPGESPAGMSPPATTGAPSPSAPGTVGREPVTVTRGPARPATSPPRTNQAPPSSGPTNTSTCFGAVRHDLDLHNTELDLVRSMCFRTGGVLRLQGIGPGLVTAEPRSLAEQNYEAGVVDIRFVRAGTVTVTIPQDGQVYTITVVVIT